MIAAQFRDLVAELEESSSGNEAGYRMRVAALAALGYLYVVAVVALLAGALWILALVMKDGRHLVLLKVAIPLAIIALVGLRALWVRLEPPEGVAISAEEAPQLFALLDKIRRRVKGPIIHRVVVDDAYNAAIMQLPRFGLLGGSRNYLIIGLPLMQTLPVEQFAAVLAHEYGHLSGAHGRFSAWIYRVRVTWARILDALCERPVWGGGVFLHFFRWYVPYFEAYTFVLARNNEYEADRVAADVMGERVMADALVQVEIGARFMDERFWPRFLGGADRSPAPAALPYTQLPRSLEAGLDANDAQAWLKAALLQKTGVVDTHPCLKDRIEALRQVARVPEKPASNAARVLLGVGAGAVRTRFDREWAKRNLAAWGERHREAATLKGKAAAISAKAKSGAALNGAEWYDFAQACERFASADKAEGYYRRAIEAAPEHTEAYLALGELLVARRDSAGLAFLEKAAGHGGEAGFAAVAAAARFLRESGRDREAERFEVKLMAQSAQAQQHAAHQVFLTPEDAYAPHGLSMKELGACRATFKRLARVDKVHAVKKILPRTGEGYLVFLVAPKVGLFQVLWNMVLSHVGVSQAEDKLGEEVSRALRLAVPFTVFLDLYQDDDANEKIAAVDGALIFDPDDR